MRRPHVGVVRAGNRWEVGGEAGAVGAAAGEAGRHRVAEESDRGGRDRAGEGKGDRKAIPAQGGAGAGAGVWPRPAGPGAGNGRRTGSREGSVGTGTAGETGGRQGSRSYGEKCSWCVGRARGGRSVRGHGEVPEMAEATDGRRTDAAGVRAR